MTPVKDGCARNVQRAGMAHPSRARVAPAVPDASEVRRRRRYLARITGGRASLRRSATWLVFDAIAAIGFAAGLAGAVAAMAGGRTALPWLGLVLLAGVVRAALILLAARTGAVTARDAKHRLRARIVAAVLHRPPGVSTTGHALAAAVDEVEAIDGYVAHFLPARVAAGAATLLVLVAAALASPISAGIMASTLVPFVGAMILAGGAAATESQRQFGAMARLSAIFVDRVRALPLILAFQAEDGEARRIGRAADEVARRTLKVLAVAFLSSGALEFFAALSVALVAVYAGFSLLGLLPFRVPETLDLGRAFFVLALAPEFYAPLRRLAAAYHDKQAAETAADRLQAIEQDAPAAIAPILLAAPPALRFDDVAIAYSGAATRAISGFSLAVRPGESVALCGPSGCGKTSLLHLLLGLAPRAAGGVTVDGEALALQGGVTAGWAGQSPLILAGTLAENILLGQPHANRAAIARAAEAAGLGAVLARRGGLDARIDERGGGLSGGERCRIGLARAILSDAPLLLLDEPTAHLDAAAEAALVATIARIATGRTVLIATHSRALAAIADRIVTLDIPGDMPRDVPTGIAA